MEFPDAGKHCFQPDCKQLGEYAWWFVVTDVAHVQGLFFFRLLAI
jgi:hypothetical protein